MVNKQYSLYHCLYQSLFNIGYLILLFFLEKTKHLLFQGAEASFHKTDLPITIEKIPCDSKPSKQLQLDFNGKLYKPDLKFKVYKQFISLLLKVKLV